METVLITGASRGFGLEIARLFSRSGCRLFLHSRVSEIPEFTGAEYLHGDLSRRGAVSDIADRIGSHVDIFINNAGIYQNKPFSETSAMDFLRIMEVNLIAPALLIKTLWPIGLLVNINSVAGKQGSPGESGYCASKHGLRGLSTSLDYDTTASGGRIMDVYLGAMKTDMTIDREGRSKFIDPVEAADTVFNLCQKKDTMQVRELTISRTQY